MFVFYCTCRKVKLCMAVEDAIKLPEDHEGVYVMPINSKCREVDVPRLDTRPGWLGAIQLIKLTSTLPQACHGIPQRYDQQSLQVEPICPSNQRTRV